MLSDKTSNELERLFFSYTPYTNDPNRLSDPAPREINITNLVPESLSYSYSPIFSAQEVLGRMSPIQLYTGGSDKKYSFTIEIHEDMLNKITKGAYTRIDDFVDDIKAMSYPYLDDADNLNAQRVYFEIGEVTGSGYVETSISWKKPIRDGRYIIVDISFNITVEEIYPKVDSDVAEEESTYKLSYATYYGNIRLDETTSQLITEMESFLGYELNISDFFSSDHISLEEMNSNIKHAENYFDSAYIKFSNLLDMVATLDPDSDTIDNLRGTVEKIESVGFGRFSEYWADSSLIHTETFDSFTDVKSTLETLKDDLVEYIEEDYYKVVNTSLTTDERDAIISDIEITINAMILLYEEVSGYGRSE